MKTNWSQITLKDLNFINSYLKENHPGYVEKKCSYPVFIKWIDKGFDKAVKKSKLVKSKKDYKKIINYYVSGFNDRHLRLTKDGNFKNPKKANINISSIKEFKDDMVLVTIKSFFPRNNRQQRELEKTARNIKNYKNKKMIVFDLRGIEGGNTQWGIDIINNLYGKRYLNSLKNYPYRKIRISCRVSKDNYYAIIKILNRKNMNYETKKYYQKMAIEMKKALKNNIDLVNIEYGKNFKKFDKVKSPFNGIVYVITDDSAISATLLFLDRLLSIKNVIQVGRPTGGDTVYCEVRTVKLPSGNYHLVLPTTVKNFMIRKNNEKYIPKYRYNGKMTNSDKLRKWIFKLNNKIKK